jgi:hypothetical protein
MPIRKAAAAGEGLKCRYGDNLLDSILPDNLAFSGQQMEVYEIVAKTEELVRLSAQS